MAIIGNALENSNIENVHINSATINVENNSDVNAAVLAATTSEANIQNCSIIDSTINVGNTQQAGIVKVGGIVGTLGVSKIYNSYTKDLKINVSKATSSDGIGGIAGYTNTNSVVQACYSHGEINSSKPNVGGIVGYSYGSLINNCYSAMQVESDVGYIGGIIGSQVLYDAEKSYGNIAIGGIYCKADSENANRIMGSFSPIKNYAYKGQIINGLKSDEEMDATLLTKEELQNKDTYTTIIGWDEDYNYDDVEKGILPKLYYKGTTNILPHQEEHIHIEEENGLSIENLTFDEKNLTGVITLKNPNKFTITSIKIEDMICNSIETEIQGETTYIDFKVTPEKYYDSYKLYEIVYEKNGKTETKKVEAKIDAVLYKEISTFDEWQEIEGYQNYRLTADIDFTGKQNIKTGLKIGRLIGSVDPQKKCIVGSLNGEEQITISIDKVNTGLIEEISTEMTGIIFKNINIKYTGTATARETYSASDKAKNFGLISSTTGEIANVEFNNITIDTERKLNNVGIIGRANYAEVNDIKINDIEVYGKHRVGGLFGEITEINISDIEAANVTVEGKSYVGGIGGYKTFRLGTKKIVKTIKANNIKVNRKRPCWRNFWVWIREEFNYRK